jgi:DNA-binding LacI/PurR family transcriptional regulator
MPTLVHQGAYKADGCRHDADSQRPANHNAAIGIRRNNLTVCPAQERGFEMRRSAIPDDLTIVGYHDAGIATQPSHNLNGVDQCHTETALNAVNATLASIGTVKTTLGRKIVVPLVVQRGSTTVLKPL